MTLGHISATLIVLIIFETVRNIDTAAIKNVNEASTAAVNDIIDRDGIEVVNQREPIERMTNNINQFRIRDWIGEDKNTIRVIKKPADETLKDYVSIRTGLSDLGKVFLSAAGSGVKKTGEVGVVTTQLLRSLTGRPAHYLRRIIRLDKIPVVGDVTDYTMNKFSNIYNKSQRGLMKATNEVSGMLKEPWRKVKPKYTDILSKQKQDDDTDDDDVFAEEDNKRNKDVKPKTDTDSKNKPKNDVPSKDKPKNDVPSKDKPNNNMQPKDKPKDNTQPKDKPENNTRPKDKPKDNTQPKDKPNNNTQPKDKPKNNTQPKDKPKNNTQPKDKSKDNTEDDATLD